jgi:tetratricopeptide (TPR) repeat protein
MKVNECPQCGAPASITDKKCKYCSAEFIVSNLFEIINLSKTNLNKYVNHFTEITKTETSNAESFFSLGLCYLQLKMYPLSIHNFKEAITRMPENSDFYYYYALSLIKGRRPKTLHLNEAKEILEYLDTATQLDPSIAKYDYLHSIIKYDYFRSNGLKVNPPTDIELIENAKLKKQEPEEIKIMLDYVLIRDENLISAIMQVK